jgi:hypothetical protein
MSAPPPLAPGAPVVLRTKFLNEETKASQAHLVPHFLGVVVFERSLVGIMVVPPNVVARFLRFL